MTNIRIEQAFGTAWSLGGQNNIINTVWMGGAPSSKTNYIALWYIHDGNILTCSDINMWNCGWKGIYLVNVDNSTFVNGKIEGMGYATGCTNNSTQGIDMSGSNWNILTTWELNKHAAGDTKYPLYAVREDANSYGNYINGLTCYAGAANPLSLTSKGDPLQNTTYTGVRNNGQLVP